MPKNMSMAEWAKRRQALYDAFIAIPGCSDWIIQARGSDKNDIARAVNAKVPAADAGLKDKHQKAYYDYLWKDAELHQEAYGFWPTFDMCEMESDDPRLDRYSDKDSADKWVAERKNKK